MADTVVVPVAGTGESHMDFDKLFGAQLGAIATVAQANFVTTAKLIDAAGAMVAALAFSQIQAKEIPAGPNTVPAK